MGGGGAEILLGAIAEELHKKGHTVSIACLEEHHSTYENFPNKKFIDKHINLVRIRSSVTFKFLGRTTIDNKDYVNLVDSFKPDVIHSNLYRSELIAYSYLKSEIAYFSHGHDNIKLLKKFGWKTMRSKGAITDYYESLWLKSHYKKANASFLTISKDTQDYFSKNVPSALKKRVHLLPNAINLKRFKRENENETFTLISIGNLLPVKGHDLLIKTIKQLKDENIIAELYILGYGPLLKELKNLSVKLGVDDLIHFEGNVANVEAYLKNAHIYIHGAKSEAFGLALIEAMASGLPVISTDGKGNRDLIENGFNGYLIKERKPELLAEKIKYLLNNETVRHQTGINAQKFSKQFDIERYVEKLLDIYIS